MNRIGDVLTVSQLNRYLRYKFDEDPQLDRLLIRGEISNFVHHIKTGHLYFTLKDGAASLKVVMFRSYAQNLIFRPQDGLHVLIRGKVSVYEKEGAYQLYAYELLPDGVGEQYLAYEQLKKELQALGMTDPTRKKPIPRYPSCIGIITSPVGAVFHDMTQILARRYPAARVIFCPAAVQGPGAAGELVRAVRALNRQGECDVILLGRGGGSAEDLSAFNDRELAFAVFQSKIPVVSAVGHETDFTICDLVADLRAPTPSAAAELVTPDTSELLALCRRHAVLLKHGMQRRLQQTQAMLERHSNARRLTVLKSTLHWQEKQLLSFQVGLRRQAQTVLQDYGHRLAEHAQKVNDLSPLGVLARGYAAVLQNGRRVSGAAQLAPGDEVLLCFYDGERPARILEKEERA